MDFLGIGSGEMLLIAVIAVLLFGDRLPEVARMGAKVSKRVREAAAEFQDAIKLDD